MQPTAVTLADVLRARDKRAARQTEFLARYGSALISFTMNIPGPVKCDPEIERAFMIGVERVRDLFSEMHYNTNEAKIIVAPTGCEMLWAVDADPTELKRKLMVIEDEHPLGRLFDMDVITPEGKHISRRQERPCLICGQPVRACARSRAHSAEELFAKVKEIIANYFAKVHLLRIGTYAAEALLHEAFTTPKPGLVDRRDSGAHDDMDLQTLLSSIRALAPYFEYCAYIGAEGADPLVLQRAGQNAEKIMYKAVGVNTHKGAIFSMGILCCAAGAVGEGASLDALLDKAASLGQFYLDQMKQSPPEDTGGGQQYLRYGLTGARGEAAAGFPSVRNISLPVLQAALTEGYTENDAGVRALITLIAHVQDSNIIRRVGMEGQRWASRQAQHVLERGCPRGDLRTLNKAFTQRRISPGGCADLLAVTYFLHYLITRGAIMDKSPHFSFFQNRECEYFPCHEGVAEEDFNCLFCYCPLYALGKKCGGGCTYNEWGYKDCTHCTFPHQRKNYLSVISRYEEVMEVVREQDKQRE